MIFIIGLGLFSLGGFFDPKTPNGKRWHFYFIIMTLFLMLAGTAVEIYFKDMENDVSRARAYKQGLSNER